MIGIGVGEVHVWYADPRAAEDASLRRDYESLLSADEARRYRAFHVERAQREFLVARALVRTTLSRHVSVRPMDWRFETTPGGRPEISPASRLRFNLSHCDGLVVCAVTRRLAVGVDAEPWSRGSAVLRIGSRVLSDAEREALSDLPPQARADRAVSLWTLKECYAKALGAGLCFPLPAVSFELGSGRVVLSDGWSREGARFRFVLLDVGAHCVAVAVEGEPAMVRLWSTVPLAGYERRQLTRA